MERLEAKLTSAFYSENGIEDIYAGTESYCDKSDRPPVTQYDPVYYAGGIGYEYTVTKKNDLWIPTVTVAVPVDIFNEKTEKGNDALKRLFYYLKNMDNETATYKEMYDGETVVHRSPKSNGDERHPYNERSSIYYDGDRSFTIELTNKLAKDKPTVTYNIPLEKLGSESTCTAAADYCLRAFAPYIDELNAELNNRSRPDKENGRYYICRPGGEIVKRNSAYFALCPQRDYEYLGGNSVRELNDGIPRPPRMCLCIRMMIQLPAKKMKRTIRMLTVDLPAAVDKFLAYFDMHALNRAVELAEKQTAIREWLKTSGYCAFIANGSVLPRSKGTDSPLKDAVPFRSAARDEIEICGVRGMGIRRGVTVISGGGYSGKSTLLDAISAGIYDHVMGDGRELCITDETAVTVSAEDGRSVKHVNISPFIKWIPGGDTRDFSTDHASGSTSQAANIMEAVDQGARLLLIDEDRSATNFMIRDSKMKELIEKEPITPFTDRVNELFTVKGVSTVLVIGGSGEYLGVADRIYVMEDFLISDVTEKAKAISGTRCVKVDIPPSADWLQNRRLLSVGFSSYPKNCTTEKLEITDMGFILIGDERIDVRGLHDIASQRQLDALGFMLRYLEVSNCERRVDIVRRIDELYGKIENEGLDTVYSSFFTATERFLDLPRRNELLAVIARMRNVIFIKGEDG